MDDENLLTQLLQFEEAANALEDVDQWLRNVLTPRSVTVRALHRYTCGTVARVLELFADTARLIREGRNVSASMTARGIVETIGNFAYLVDKLLKALRSEDREAFRNLVRQYSFASREFNPDARQPHISDGVRALEKRHPGAEELYNVLCEVVHPNWAGITVFGNTLHQSMGAVEQRVIVSCLAPRHYVSTFKGVLENLFNSIQSSQLAASW